VDRIAAAETGLQEVAATLGEVTETIQEITELTTTAAAKMKDADKRTNSMAGRIVLYKEFAEELAGPAQNIQDLSNLFTRHLNDVDSGIRAIFEKAREELDSGESGPELIEKVDEFADQLRDLADSSETGLGSLQLMVDAISGAEKQSRSLRPVLRKMRRGLAVLIDGKNVIRNWVDLADAFERPNAVSLADTLTLQPPVNLQKDDS
jgi:methyl-accepting chemotaxis protein